MQHRELPGQIGDTLSELFTRVYQSAGNYAAESEPYQVPADADLLEALEALRVDDRRHALLLANLLQYFDLVPESGVFPYWYRDLNYMTVPFLAGFVVQSLEDDLGLYDAALAATPEDLHLVHTALRTIRKERAARLELLRPLVAAAREREAAQYAADAAAIAATRSERLAKEKAAAEAVRKAQREAKAKAKAAAAPPAADPAAGLPDPSEPGLSSKEKAKRTMMIKRAAKKAAAAPAASADPAAGLPDPHEPGISSKEKAKRTMMIKRAAKKATAAAPAASADPAAGLPDPNEEGLSSKEKAKRTMMIRRARKKAQG